MTDEYKINPFQNAYAISDVMLGAASAPKQVQATEDLAVDPNIGSNLPAYIEKCRTIYNRTFGEKRIKRGDIIAYKQTDYNNSNPILRIGIVSDIGDDNCWIRRYDGTNEGTLDEISIEEEHLIIEVIR